MASAPYWDCASVVRWTGSPNGFRPRRGRGLVRGGVPFQGFFSVCRDVKLHVRRWRARNVIG